MTKTSGTQVQIGLGIESLAAPNVAVAEAVFIPWTGYSMQAVAEKSMFKSARGIRNETSNSMIRRKYSEGSISVVPNTAVVPYFLSLAMGGVSSASIVDGTYTHTFTIQNTNASVRTATLTAEEGAIQTTQYTNVVCNSLNFEVSDEYAAMTAELIGGFPSTDTISESYSQETEFAYHQMTVKFGTTLSNADSASATALKAFSLNINNNIQIDEAFLSGSNEIVSGCLIPSRLSITGSYSLHFEDTTELAKYKANTLNAAVVALTGPVVGGGTTTEKITFRIGDLVLTKPPVEYNIDGLLVLTQEFEVQYDATDLELTATVTNLINNASTTVYDPA